MPLQTDIKLFVAMMYARDFNLARRTLLLTFIVGEMAVTCGLSRELGSTSVTH